MTNPKAAYRSVRAMSKRWWLLLAVALLLLLARASGLLAAGANNLAARALVGEWQVIGKEAGLPQCREWLPASAAESYLAVALSRNLANERAWLNRGRVAWLVGDCQKARASWQQAVQAAPGDKIAALWLFWALEGDADNLPGLLSKEDLASYTYQAGRNAGGGEAGDGGSAWLELSLAVSPDRETAELLANLYRRAGRTEAAAGVWHRVAAALPEEQPDHWWALGQAAEIEADWTRAAWAYRRGADVAGDPYQFWLEHAAALEQLNRWPEAEDAYRQAMIARPQVARPYLRLGDLRAGQGDYEGALGWYSQAQALDPQINPFYLVGNRCWQQEQPAEARAWLEKALQLEPEHLQANYLMAQSLYRLGEKVQAMAFLDQAVSLPSGQPDWRWVVQLGDWRLELGDRQGALTAYRRALELRPGETTIEERIDKLAESGN